MIESFAEELTQNLSFKDALIFSSKFQHYQQPKSEIKIAPLQAKIEHIPPCFMQLTTKLCATLSGCFLVYTRKVQEINAEIEHAKTQDTNL